MLKSPQQHSRFESGVCRERWRLDLSAEPQERLVCRAHEGNDMSEVTYVQEALRSISAAAG